MVLFVSSYGRPATCAAAGAAVPRLCAPGGPLNNVALLMEGITARRQCQRILSDTKIALAETIDESCEENAPIHARLSATQPRAQDLQLFPHAVQHLPPFRELRGYSEIVCAGATCWSKSTELAPEEGQ